MCSVKCDNQPSDEASELRIEIARVLERWQRERMEAEHEAEQARDAQASQTPGVSFGSLNAAMAALQKQQRAAVLSECIDAIKAAVGKPAQHRGCLDVIVAGGAGAPSTHACDQCGATLALLVEPGEPSLMFCMQCQPEVMASIGASDPEELAAALVNSWLPPASGGTQQSFVRPRPLHGGAQALAVPASLDPEPLPQCGKCGVLARPAERMPLGTFTCDACGALWQRARAGRGVVL